MKAFYGKQELKDKYVKQLEKHYANDEIVQGVYWEKGKGCAIGCLLHSNNSNQHIIIKELFNFPRIVARLADSIFEGLSNIEAKDFSLNWFKAIKINSDLSLVFPKFIHWLLMDKQYGIIQYAKKEHVQLMQNIANLFKRKIDGEVVSNKEFTAAAAAAYAYAATYAATDVYAAYAAYAATDVYAAYAAATAYAADADADAGAGSYGAYAAYAAYAVDAAAAAAAATAYAAAAAATAYAADARKKARTYQAAKFIELIKNA